MTPDSRKGGRKGKTPAVKKENPRYMEVWPGLFVRLCRKCGKSISQAIFLISQITTDQNLESQSKLKPAPQLNQANMIRDEPLTGLIFIFLDSLMM